MLYQALGNHRIRHLDEARDVRALDVIDVAVLLSAISEAGLVDVGHDAVQLLIDFLGGPLLADRVLGHLKTGGRHASRIRSLARRIQQPVLLEYG